MISALQIDHRTPFHGVQFPGVIIELKANNDVVLSLGEAMRRRDFIKVIGGMAAAWPLAARAQSYPMRSVRWIVGFAAGGPNDILARLIGQWLSDRLGQQFVIENRPGAGGSIGTEAVVNAPADGYTLLLVSTANAVNATLYGKLNYNFVHEIAPIVGIMRVPNIMEVNPSVPVKTVQEFIAYAKANPGKINMGSGGNGTSQHVSGELFKMLTGVDMVHVPFRGAALALTDLLGGQLQVMFDPMPNAIGQIKAGKLRPLAVTTAMRSETLPDLPTVAEFVPGYEASSWYGVGVPKNAPAEIVAKLNQEINAALTDRDMKVRFSELGGTVLGGLPSDFATLIAAETEKWGKVVKFSGAKLD
jgi:tripartite-type tricarboxylate transporter receptor subunit TctC